MADLYDSLEDALYYAAQGVYDADRNTTEHMSLLYRMPDGRYGITAPAGEGNKKGVKQKITYPAEAAIAALMHNHPSIRHTGQQENMFSADDVDQATKLNVPSYITHGKDMRIRSFTPGVDRTRGALRASAGQPFDHIPEVQPAGQRIAPKTQALVSALRGTDEY